MADVGDDVRGADVVVLAEDGDLRSIARSAPAATIVVVGDGLEDRCKEVYERAALPARADHRHRRRRSAWAPPSSRSSSSATTPTT